MPVHRHCLPAASALVTLLALSLVSVSADAQEDKAAQASRLYVSGTKNIIKGKYADAIVDLKMGYNLVPNGMFLYNLSIAYNGLGKPDEALRTMERALEDKGLPKKVRVQANARRLGYERVLRVQRASKGIAEAAVRRKASKWRPGPVAQEEGGFTAVGWLGTGLAVVGVGFLGASLYTNLEVAGRLNDDNSVKDGESVADVESLQSRGRTFLFVGLGAAATGALLMGIDAASNKPTKRAWTPTLSPTPDGGMVGVSGSF